MLGPQHWDHRHDPLWLTLGWPLKLWERGVPGSPSQLGQLPLFTPYQSLSLLEFKWIPE